MKTAPFRSICFASLFLFHSGPSAGSTLIASYFSMTGSDPDVGNNQGQGSLVSTVGVGLSANGIPLVNTSVSAGAQLKDVNTISHELGWWSPALDSNVSVLNNPVYPAQITLPFLDDNMFTNTTVLGQDGNNGGSFLTAKFVGQFSLPSAGNIAFNVCSDDDEFVYISGGVFGKGTLVVDNGGIHGKSCTTGNVNTNLLTNAASGTYTLTVFYDDRERVAAAFELSSTLNLSPVSTGTPEPTAVLLLSLGFGFTGMWQIIKRASGQSSKGKCGA